MAWYDPSTWFSSSGYDDPGLTNLINASNQYGGVGFSSLPDYLSQPLAVNEALAAQGYTVPALVSWNQPLTPSLYDELGGMRGVASLGLGGLSMLGNYLSKKEADELAREQFDRTLGFKEKELATTSATDLAKADAMMNLLAQRGRAELDPRRYAEIVASGQIPPEMLATQERIDIGRRNFAQGGGALGLLRGGSPGQRDDVNAALSHGEYVMDGDVVAALGDGNTEAGARRLDEMREAIRRHKRSAPTDDIPPPARHPLAYLKGMK
jgi:hypothetical protein